MSEPNDVSVHQSLATKIIVLDGPEAAGKSTLASAILKLATEHDLHARVRRWGKLRDEYDADRIYGEFLKVDHLGIYDLVVWDRSWASESVYGMMLKRDRRLSDDWEMGDALYATQIRDHCGMLVMVLGPDVNALVARRAARHLSDDLDVDVGQERAMFERYARQFQWMRLTHVTPETAASWLLQTLGVALNG